MLGFASSNRAIGAAVMTGSTLTDLKPHRVNTKLGIRTQNSALRRWLRMRFVRHEPQYIVVLDGARGSEALVEMLRGVAPDAVSLIPVRRAEVVRHLGLAHDTDTAILRELARRHSYVRSVLVPFRGIRSESERYWGIAILAAAAACAAVDC